MRVNHSTRMGDKLEQYMDVFLIFYKILCVECTHQNHIDEAILMSTHSIHFHDKIGNIPKIYLNICFLELWENFLETQNRV